MGRTILYLIMFFVSFAALQAQELNARLTINTQKIQSADRELFTSLETNLNQLLNDQKWTNETFRTNEKIDCTIAITINENLGENAFLAEIQLTSRRPVYNSTYVTSIFNFRDTQFEFVYLQNQSLDFNAMSMDNNLVAVISFYVNVLLGLDFDSFSMNGGRNYFSKAMEIANMAQSLNTKGWEPFSGRNSNRYDLAIALTEESSSVFHEIWYNYHRLGLDEMAANVTRGRIRAMEAFSEVSKLYEARPSSVLLTIMGETKLDEIVKISSQATNEEKQNMKKLLSRIFPTKSYILNMLN